MEIEGLSTECPFFRNHAEKAVATAEHGSLRMPDEASGRRKREARPPGAGPDAPRMRIAFRRKAGTATHARPRCTIGRYGPFVRRYATVSDQCSAPLCSYRAQSLNTTKTAIIETATAPTATASTFQASVPEDSELTVF